MTPLINKSQPSPLVRAVEEEKNLGIPGGVGANTVKGHMRCQGLVNELTSTLKQCPWPESVWPTTVQQAGKVMRTKLSGKDITAISGTLMRHGWQCAEKAIQELLSEQTYRHPLDVKPPSLIAKDMNERLNRKRQLDVKKASVPSSDADSVPGGNANHLADQVSENPSPSPSSLEQKQ